MDKRFLSWFEISLILLGLIVKKIISDLFDLYVQEPDLLPKQWIDYKNEREKHIVVCDYISGMTDKYAINIHKKFFDLYNF